MFLNIKKNLLEIISNTIVLINFLSYYQTLNVWEFTATKFRNKIQLFFFYKINKIVLSVIRVRRSVHLPYLFNIIIWNKYTL